MSLKTDYLDFIASEDGKKYSISANADGTSNITDVTTYEQTGDAFGAADINATNEAVNTAQTTADTAVSDAAAAQTTASAALPKSGGTMTGALSMGSNAISTSGTVNLTSTNSIFFRGTNGAKIYSPSLQLLTVAPSTSELDYYLKLGNIDGWCICMATGGLTNLGHSSYRWKNIYSTNSIDVSSDERLKKEITTLDDAYINMLLSLPARSYRWKESEQKIQLGFIAQEVAAAMQAQGINEDAYALISHYDKTETVQVMDVEYDEELEDYVDTLQEAELENGEDEYALRYEHFIPILTALCQKQQTQIDALTAQNQEILARLSALEENQP